MAHCFHTILGSLKNNEYNVVKGKAQADTEKEMKFVTKKVEVDMVIDNVNCSKTMGKELLKAGGGR